MSRVYWMVQTMEDLPPLDDWMAAGEAVRLRRMLVPKRQNDFRLGRWTARQALAGCPGVPAGAIEVRAAAGGAPEVLIEGMAGRCTISLSHAAGAAICALSPSGAELGCDLELVEPRSAEFIETFFTEKERLVIEASPADECALLNTAIWTAKESALKALGVGLRRDTRTVEVTLAADGPPGYWHTLIVTSDDGRALHGWWRRYGSHALSIVASPRAEQPVELAPDTISGSKGAAWTQWSR